MTFIDELGVRVERVRVEYERLKAVTEEARRNEEAKAEELRAWERIYAAESGKNLIAPLPVPPHKPILKINKTAVGESIINDAGPRGLSAREFRELINGRLGLDLSLNYAFNILSRLKKMNKVHQTGGRFYPGVGAGTM